ncbi:inositol monophosphatase family protein [Methylocaldum szegediense]|uniref:Inositol-1-monophosphatase n=1 Tax=Methylocaldum szegediense TaxID=73780 RepID=A0ABN8X9N4_9GAMM|nr:inositol monophosphatase family protein [Methylocaldum szegediense]CAI8881083.1 inositol-phosphate phosphatase [Methylocaldum szegediense]
MDPMLTIAVRAARAAGDIIVRSMDRVNLLTITPKGRNDFVSEVDRQAEREIIHTLQKAYPTHAFLGEESGRQGAAKTDFVWIIDPLDGTTNFLHGFPQFCVSIALLHRGRIEKGVIYDPLRQELFTAARGAGASLNNRRIRVSKQNGLKGALLGTGFPFKDQRHVDAYLGMLRDLMKDTAGIRRAGSAALDLAYVAAGRLDGFWEIGLKKWDMAAGVLLIQEAGGIVTDLAGTGKYFESGNVLTANPKLHQIMQGVIQPHLTDALRATVDPTDDPSE